MTGGLAGVVEVEVLGPLSFLTCLSSPSPEKLLRGRIGGFIKEGTLVRTYMLKY
jgi:hypothetical protein